MTYDEQKLIVSDLFDKKIFYKEYKRDFSFVSLPFHDITSAEFINSNKLKVSYFTGSEYKEVTETIDLSK